MIRHFCIIGLIAILAACNGLTELTTREAPHERYANQLRSADLEQSAAGSAWLSASQQALDSTVVLPLPASEIAYFNPERIQAVGYELTPEQGEELAIYLDLPENDTTRFFADLFLVNEDGSRNHVSGTEVPDTLATESTGATYILRIQPELLGGGTVSIEIQTAPTLAFPVDGHDGTDIRSFFGDSRDGGERQHQGVDIFAPRGTPVLAAATGIVRRTTADQGLGGKTVWVTAPSAGTSYYYAHLDSVLVSAPTRVSRGDTLGLVGNTGNARHTPPHLHFEVRPGPPVDPLPFINTPRPDPPAVTASTETLGTWMRTSSRANLRSGPSTGDAQIASLPANTPLLITGATNGWHRVVMPTGRAAYISAGLLTAATSSEQVAGSEQSIRHRPDATAPAIASLDEGSTFGMLGTFESYQFVETADGQRGWLRLE